MKYRRVLNQFKTLGLERVFSNNLGDAIGVSAALVRKDLARIDLEGNRRGGYAIDTMLEKLGRLLGVGVVQEAIIVGCGNLGRALLNHEAFYRDGIRIIAGFDIAPPAEESEGIAIWPMDGLEDFIEERQPKVAMIAVPGVAAAEVKDRLLASGIRGILNFAPVELKSQEHSVVHNVNIGLEVENLFFQVNALIDRENRDENDPIPCLEGGSCEEAS